MTQKMHERSRAKEMLFLDQNPLDFVQSPGVYNTGSDSTWSDAFRFLGTQVGSL